MNFKPVDMQLLDVISNIKSIPEGAINIRRDGEPVIRQSSPNIKIGTNADNNGLLVEINPGTRNESVHVPVIVTEAGFHDKVYNTFIVGEDADVTIIAGCGIHNDSHSDSGHDGIHEIIVKKCPYEVCGKHYGEGNGQGKRILNPTTNIILETGATAEMEMVQIKGVDDTVRITTAHIGDKANLKIMERLMTHGEQKAVSDVRLYIEGQGSGQILSRSIGRDDSVQVFKAALVGKNECLGHVECDSIIMDQARIQSIPELIAESADAVLTHEAAIGKIAGNS